MISIRRYLGAIGNPFSSSAETELFNGFPRVLAPEYETSTVKRDRVLKHLLRANHHNYATMYNDNRFHNQLSHMLGSAYLMGGSAENLQALYDKQSTELNPWENSPHEISLHDWRGYLGNKSFQRAYLDFFEDELVRLGYDWRIVVAEYMLGGPEPLIYGVIGGLGHPLIHLGYAFELNNREIAMEALTLAAINYDSLHQYVDKDFPNSGSIIQPIQGDITSPMQTIEQINSDHRFEGIFDTPGASNIPLLFELREQVVLEYYHKLTIDDITGTHRELTRLATLLLCATHHHSGEPAYDLFISHLLTTSYAIRTLLPELPRKLSFALLKFHWLLTIVVYCIQLRPKVNTELIDKVNETDKSWDDIVAKTLDRSNDIGSVENAHYFKVVRALKEAAQLWKSDDEFYRRAAIKFAWGFTNWVGFGVEGRYESKVQKRGQQ